MMTIVNKPQSAELYPGPGFRIKQRIRRPDVKTIERYRQFNTPDISDALNRLYTMTSEIKNQINDQTISGPACTVKVFPGDNLMVHKALDIAQPGDIIVVDASGYTRTAILGDLVATKAKHRGIQAVIVDGLVRDLPAMKDVGLPVFARGVTPIGPLHRGPGEINFPISCGGIVVMPGDILVGDSNGVVVVRRDFAEEILDRLCAERETLARYVESVKRGEFSNAWVDKTLQEAGCLSEQKDSEL